MDAAERKTAQLYDSKLAAFRRSQYEHQGSAYPADVLELISRLEVESVLDRVRPRADMQVLDIGSGGGRWTLALAPRTAGVTAVEPSALFDLLAERTRAFPNVVRYQQSFEEVQLPMTYDLVIIYGTLMYVVDDARAAAFLSKAALAVKPGGHLVIGEAVARTYQCYADWRRVDKKAFVRSAFGTCKYWEVIRPPSYYHAPCVSRGLQLTDQFESHAPVFGRTVLWPLLRSLPWPVISSYNRLLRRPYGTFKWLTDSRRMLLSIWHRPQQRQHVQLSESYR